MIQEDIENLLKNLIANGSLSNSYLSKFQTNSASNETGKTNSESTSTTLVGIYFLFLLHSFLTQKEQILVEIEKEITETIQKFDSNELPSDDAKIVLEKLIPQKMVLETNIQHLKENMNVLPFAQRKNTIEIEKLISKLEKFNLTYSSEIKTSFLNYFNNFEKNKEHLDKLAHLEVLNSAEFQEFFNLLNTSLDQTEPIVDITRLNEDFSNQLLSMFEDFFLKFKDNELKPLKFDIKIENTLGDKNNESYFFVGDELEQLEPNENQKYVPQLEINSKKTDLSLPTSSTNFGQIWDMVGSIVMNPVRTGIGIAGYPFINTSTNKIYISVNIEQEVDLSESDNLYHQIQSMRISEISDKTDSRRQLIIQEIAESLDLPQELVLYPTIVEEYLARNRGISVDFEIQKQKLRTEYYDVNRVVFDDLNGVLTIPDDLDPINSSAGLSLLPSPKNNFIDDKIMTLANGQSLGKTVAEFKLLESWYIAIELDLPSHELINKISSKLRKTDNEEENNLWKLRFTISKVLDIFEAESLLVPNLWRYIWHEKIPVSPFDLLVSFIAITPSKSINKELNNNQSVQLARGVTIQGLSSNIKHDPYTITSPQHITIGKLINFYLNPQDKQIYVIYCTISEIEILKRLNRDHSQNSLVKLGKRIYKALSLKSDKLEIELHPKYLLTYILFYSIQFNVQIDFTNIYDVIHWLITEFELKIVPIEKITSINPDNFILELES